MSRCFGAGLALLLASTLPCMAHELEVKSLRFVHPWTKEPAADVKDVPVYMTIRNSGPDNERILAGSTPLAREVRIVGGGEPGRIEVPAGQSIKLSKLGPYIELIGLTEPLTGYEMFPLWLTLEKGGRVELEVMVEENEDVAPAAPHVAAGHANEQDHDHGDHK